MTSLRDLFIKMSIAGLTIPRTAPVAKFILDRIGLKYINVALPQRIGHLALETDSYLKDKILADGRPPFSVMVEPTDGGFANPVLSEYLSHYITIIPRIHRGDIVDRALRANGYVVETAPYIVAMYETARSYDVYHRWGRREPLFALSRQDDRYVDAYLREVGIPRDAWFVCVHARGGGYSPSDEHWHAHRNVDIADYADAMDYITSRGGWCIRMGDPTMNAMAPKDRVIDYAVSSHKSARLDVGLAARCRFFLGCASGLYNIAAMFGRPAALVNVTPFSGAYALGVDDLAIPQAIVDQTGRQLGISEIFMSDAADYRKYQEFIDHDLSPMNISPQEIRELTAEILERVEHASTYTADDEARQEKFRNFLKPGHYAYGTGSRIGRDYLRRYLPLDATDEHDRLVQSGQEEPPSCDPGPAWKGGSGRRTDRTYPAGFDPAYYLRINSDVREAGQDPLEHYVGYGRREGRYPNARAAAEAEAIVAAYDARTRRSQDAGPQ